MIRPVLFILVLTILGCTKSKLNKSDCDIQQVYQDNAAKPTITDGVWGTVSFTQGNCMPVVGSGISGCVTCPAQRTVRIYEYTSMDQASYISGSSGFYESFQTQLIKEIQSDANGFYEAALPVGTYTIVVIENGKLYANLSDGHGGINPVIVEGGREKLDVNINYQAVY